MAAGATPSGAQTDGSPPAERLSWSRLAIVVLVAVLVVGTAVVRVRDAVADPNPVAQSWSVPYVDVTLVPSYQFQDPQANPARDVALAFVVADRDDPCRPSWGASYTLDDAGQELELDRRIAQLRRAGGDVMISFGGRDNRELAVACTDPAALRRAYAEVVDRYDARVVDLDVEGTALEDRASIDRRAQALAAVQDARRAAGKELDVWLTLPVGSGGLTSAGLAAVEGTLDGGLDLLGVNAMTMDYAEGGSRPPDVLSLVERSLDATAAQLTDLYGRLGTPLGAGQAWAHLGATPMIGQNDVDDEVFTLDDAAGLADYAVRKGLGRVSFWSLNRDQPCPATFPDVVIHSNTCSGIPQAPLAFANVFTSLPGRPPTAPPTDAITVPDRRSAVDDPARSPFPLWRPTAQYPEGYKVVWKGSVFQAKWWNQGVDPSTATQGAKDTPWALIGPVGADDTAPTLTTVPPGSLPEWDPNVLYDKGARIAFDGLPYQARWSTKGDAPSTQFPVGPDSPWQPTFTVPGEPVS